MYPLILSPKTKLLSQKILFLSPICRYGRSDLTKQGERGARKHFFSSKTSFKSIFSLISELKTLLKAKNGKNGEGEDRLSRHPTEWTVADVGRWLRSQGNELKEYEGRFGAIKVDGEMLVRMSAEGNRAVLRGVCNSESDMALLVQCVERVNEKFRMVLVPVNHKDLDPPKVWITSANLALLHVFSSIGLYFAFGGYPLFPSECRYITIWPSIYLTLKSLTLLKSAINRLESLKSPINPSRHAKYLATDGPFALTRNPMYAALAMLLLSTVFSTNSVYSLALLLPTALAMRCGIVLPEERYLGQRFGAGYAAYRKRVPRWIGWRGVREIKMF